MILIGRLLSPFVRRVQVSANLLGVAMERRPLSTASDAKAIGAFNPLCRVPALVLDDGEVLIDSNAILDYLEEVCGPEKALVPASGAGRRKVLNLTAFAVGAAEKAVVVFYEKTRRPEDKIWEEWVEKGSAQIRGGLGAIEQAASDDGDWLVGSKMSQADISAAVVIEFIDVVLPDLIGQRAFPRLRALTARMNELDGFTSTHPSRE